MFFFGVAFRHVLDYFVFSHQFACFHVADRGDIHGGRGERGHVRGATYDGAQGRGLSQRHGKLVQYLVVQHVESLPGLEIIFHTVRRTSTPKSCR